MYKIGRLLQLVGLTILPFAILGELLENVSLKQSLLFSAFGAILFCVGYIVQRVGRK